MGQIRLPTNIRLPEKAKANVLSPDVRVESIPRIESPRLVHPEQAADFTMEISKADLR